MFLFLVVRFAVAVEVTTSTIDVGFILVKLVIAFGFVIVAVVVSASIVTVNIRLMTVNIIFEIRGCDMLCDMSITGNT